MNSEFPAAKNIIEQSQRILFTTHERTDGDDLGSVLALANHLLQQGKDITIAIKGGTPAALQYLPLSGLVQEDIADTNFDLLIISGCSNIERCGNPAIIESGIPVLNIDHHPDNTRFGLVNVVEPEHSSVAELVYDFFGYCNWTITADIATCLVTGMFTDTGSFMHSNTKASTLKAVSELMRRGARPSVVARQTFRGKSLNALKAWGKALGNTFYDSKRRIIYSVLDAEDLSSLNNPRSGAFEGLVETLNTVPEAKFAMLLKQDGDIVKGSLRSDAYKGIDVRQIAQAFGGGGHKWAAGLSFAGKLVKNAAGAWEISN